MRPIPHVALLAVAATVALTPVALADDSRGGRNRVAVVPAVNVAGNSASDLIGDHYALNMALPAAHSPFGGTADLCLSIGHRGRVLVPTGGVVVPNKGIEMTCIVRHNRPVVVVMTSADCSDAEPEPFYGKTAAAQRACAIDWTVRQSGVTAINMSMDGRPAVDIRTPRFFAVSPQRFTVFNKDPVFGGTPGPTRFVAAGWLAEISGMNRGRHTLTAVVSVDRAPLDPFIVHFIVV